MGRPSVTGRVQARFNAILPILLVLLAARAIMLILNVPLFEIPMLDALLIDIWTFVRDLILKLANSELIPRLA